MLVQCHLCPDHPNYSMRKYMPEQICEHLTVTQVLKQYPKFQRNDFMTG